jgi:SAM-dependent methyltransferase
MAEHHATEKVSLEEAIARLPAAERAVGLVLARLSRIQPVPPGASLVDVGAAQGRWVVACAKAGYRAIGVEPWEDARAIAERLAEHAGVQITVLPGVAESLPLPSNEFDVVLAQSVLEHVQDAQVAMNEACRVLKPGGVFWFYTASSLCPFQGEIGGFPLFGWYPDRLKRRIMEWAKTHRPHLVGGTEMPAIHWFTPWKARRMLRQAGFSRVYDRWNLRLESEGGSAYRLALRVIRLCAATKFIANVLVPSCAYAAYKE